MTQDYRPITAEEPPCNVPVITKIDDIEGCRNEGVILFRLAPHGNLWFFEDGSMYVYYTPTHWKPKEST